MNSLESILNNLLQSTNYEYIYKTQLLQYNINLNYVNFIINTPNYFICIYSNCIQNLEKFIIEINNLSQYYHKKCIGIYINILNLTTHQEKIIVDENKKNINYFINISNVDNNRLINKFLRILYSYGIYCYDNSGDCIMIK